MIVRVLCPVDIVVLVPSGSESIRRCIYAVDEGESEVGYPHMLLIPPSLGLVV